MLTLWEKSPLLENFSLEYQTHDGASSKTANTTRYQQAIPAQSNVQLITSVTIFIIISVVHSSGRQLCDGRHEACVTAAVRTVPWRVAGWHCHVHRVIVLGVVVVVHLVTLALPGFTPQVWTRKCPVQTQATNSHTIPSEHGNAPFKHKQQIHTPFSLNTEMPRSNPSNKFTHHSVSTWKCPVQTQATNSHAIPSEHGNAPFKPKQQIHTPFSLNTEMPRSNRSNKFTHHSVWTWKCPVQIQATNSHTIQSQHGNAPFKSKQQIHTPSVWTRKCPVQTQATNSHFTQSEHGNTPFKHKQQIHTPFSLNTEMPRSNPSNKFTHHSVWTQKCPV